MTLAEADILVALDHKAPGVVRPETLTQAHAVLVARQLAQVEDVTRSLQAA